MKRLDGRSGLTKQDWLNVDMSIFIKSRWRKTFATEFSLWDSEQQIRWWHRISHDDPLNVNFGQRMMVDFRRIYNITKRWQ